MYCVWKALVSHSEIRLKDHVLSSGSAGEQVQTLGMPMLMSATALLTYSKSSIFHDFMRIPERYPWYSKSSRHETH